MSHGGGENYNPRIALQIRGNSGLGDPAGEFLHVEGAEGETVQ